MHGDLAADDSQRVLVAGRLQGDENAKLAEVVGNGIVDVGGNDTIIDGQQCRTTQAHVFADGRDGVLDGVRYGLARCRVGRSADRIDRTVGGQGNLGDAADQVLEGIVAGHEIGFRVDLDDDSRRAGAGDADQTFGCGAAGLLVGLGDALGAQPVDRSFHVAIVFGKRLLAVHHACARLLAQFLHHCGCDFGHYVPLVFKIASAGRSSAKAALGTNVPGNMTG